MSTRGLLLAVLITAAGCSDRSTPAPPGGSNPPTSDLSPDAGPTALNDADLIAYQAGITKEIEVARSSQVSATTDGPKDGETSVSRGESATVVAGAEASGLPPGRYEQVRMTVHQVFSSLHAQGKLAGFLSAEQSAADEAIKDPLEDDAFAGLPEDSAFALRAHMERLVPLWAEYVGLTAHAR